MRAAVFGSCMSNLTMAHLKATYGYEQTHSIHHNRTDAFIRYHMEGAEMIPLERLEADLRPRPELAEQANFILRNQYAEHMGLHELVANKEKYGTFLDYLKNDRWDFILLDNFMDLAAKLTFDRFEDPEKSKPLFLNAGFYENEVEIADRFYHVPFLTPEESAENWRVIYRWLRKYQPTAKMFFIPYHSCSSAKNSERRERIERFYPLFADAMADEDIHVLPPLNVRPELTKGEEDWPHFDHRVYQAIAGHIYLAMEADLPPPSRARQS